MNKTIKKLWLKALRSGKYKQGEQSLRTKYNEFCCLGVLCDLHAKKFKHRWIGLQYLSNNSFLPRVVIKWAGLENKNPKIKSKEAENLSNANDNGTSFKRIANIIEKQL